MSKTSSNIIFSSENFCIFYDEEKNIVTVKIYDEMGTGYTTVIPKKDLRELRSVLVSAAYNTQKNLFFGAD